MNCFRFINIFNNDNSNNAYIKAQHYQIMSFITYMILKFESMIEKAIVTNHAFSIFTTFSKINFHQDNLSFVFFLQFYKHNFLNILADNISCCIRVKNQ